MMASGNVSSNAGNADYIHSMGSRNSAFSAAAVNGGVPPQGGFATTGEQISQGRPAASLTAEHPAPAVGAEVDCPGGSYVEASALLPEHHRTAASAAVSAVPPAMQRGRRRPHRPEDRNCCCCEIKFERQGRSFNRRAVFTFTTAATVKWAFPDAQVHDKSFLCETCAQVIRIKCKRKQTGQKRSVWVKPPPKQSDGSERKKTERRMGKKSRAAELVSKSCYKSALKMLWSAKGARKPMMDFWCQQLKQEMKVLSRQTGSPFHQKVSSRKALTAFPWRRCLKWAQEKAPLVTTCLRSMFPDIATLTKIGHALTEEQAQTLLERRAVVALSIPLFTRNIWKNNFLQAALGAELRLQGCSGSAIDTLNTMGLCQNKDTIRLLLQRLFGKRTKGGQLLKLKGEPISDVEEEEIEEEVEVDIDEDDDEEELVEGDNDDEDELELEVEEEEEVEDEEVQIGTLEEDDDDDVDEQDPPAKVKVEKKRRKKAKRERKERSNRKAEREEDEDEGGSVQKKRRVVVVRFGDDSQTLDDLTFQLPKTL